MKEISPKFYQYLEDLEIEKKKMEEKARQDAEELQARPIRDKTERPLKKAEFIAASEKRKQQGEEREKKGDGGKTGRKGQKGGGWEKWRFCSFFSP